MILGLEGSSIGRKGEGRQCKKSPEKGKKMGKEREEARGSSVYSKRKENSGKEEKKEKEIRKWIECGGGRKKNGMSGEGKERKEGGSQSKERRRK